MLRTRWTAVALALVVVGYSTLLVYHVTSRFEIIADIQEKHGRYLDVGHGADGGGSVLAVYPDNLGQLLLSTARLVSGVIEDRVTLSAYLVDPWILAPTALTLAGLVVAVRRPTAWLVTAVLLAMLVPPSFSGKYRPILDGRFLMPLVPILFIAIGLAAVTATRRVIESAERLAGSDRSGSRLARLAVYSALAAGLMLLCAHSTELLNQFYKNSIEDGFSNADYLAALGQLQAVRRADEKVLLDPLLFEVKSPGGGKALASFNWILAVSRIPVDAPASLPDPSMLIGRLAILHRATAASLPTTVTLIPLDGKRTQNGKSGPSYRVYRIGGG